MASGRIERTYELFEAALARVPDERASWLAGACAQDDELRREVLSLLEHDRRSGDRFLQPLAPPPDAAAGRPPGARFPPEPELPAGTRLPLGPELPAGTRVGRCRITRLIGRGGMADVYEGVQDDPERVVALKVLRRDAASRSALRRFQFERQVLARMRHPNVAQIFEAGICRLAAGGDGTGASSLSAGDARAMDRGSDEEDADARRDVRRRDGDVEERGDADAASGGAEATGQAREVAYFVMEYIPGGRPITEFVGESGADVRRRVELFARVCDAVHHGHQKGVIHRDLKPANILIGLDGEPKVIDFGVARATDCDVTAATHQTDAGLLVGTLQYMSPEQCDADPHDIDTRSDVYSLGVVLYELLAGRPPYDVTGTSIFRAAKLIKEAAPGALFTRSGALPELQSRRDARKLEAIVGMALAKDRERRYASAADLAADLRGFCAREPIIARPPSAWERAVHWIGRHPVLATTTMCLGVALAVVFGTWATVWYINERPTSIRVTPDHACAQLLTLTGRILHEWGAGSPEAVRYAVFVPPYSTPATGASTAATPSAGGSPRDDARTARPCGGRVVIGFNDCASARYARGVCAFDADSPSDEPIWTSRIEPGEPLPDPNGRGYEAARFAFDAFYLLDVFDEIPGPEVVATFYVRPYTQAFLRIHALSDGELLYQAWHDGTLGTMCWLSGPRLLVVLGNNAAVPGERRGLKMGDVPNPNTIFALRPTLRFVAHDYLRTEPADEPPGLPVGRSSTSPDARPEQRTPPNHEPLHPAWYLYLAPADSADLARNWAMREPHIGDPKSSFRLQVEFSTNPGMSVWWEVDAGGREIPGTRVVTDAYKRRLAYPPTDPRREHLPDPDTLMLLPLPPIQAESTSP